MPEIASLCYSSTPSLYHMDAYPKNTRNDLKNYATNSHSQPGEPIKRRIKTHFCRSFEKRQEDKSKCSIQPLNHIQSTRVASYFWLFLCTFKALVAPFIRVHHPELTTTAVTVEIHAAGPGLMDQVQLFSSWKKGKLSLHVYIYIPLKVKNRNSWFVFQTRLYSPSL